MITRKRPSNTGAGRTAKKSRSATALAEQKEYEFYESEITATLDRLKNKADSGDPVSTAVLNAFCSIVLRPPTHTLHTALVAAPDHSDNANGRKPKITLDGMIGNLGLLLFDPVVLSKEWLNDPLPLRVLNDQMSIFWSNAEKLLREQKHGIPGLPFIKERDLDKFEDPKKAAILNEGQKNALEVFRSIRRIQSLMFLGVPVYELRGPIQYDPIRIETGKDTKEGLEIGKLIHQAASSSFHLQRDNLLGRLFVEFSLLTLAAVKCDFYRWIWPHVETSGRSLFGATSHKPRVWHGIVDELLHQSKKVTPWSIQNSLKAMARKGHSHLKLTSDAKPRLIEIGNDKKPRNISLKTIQNYVSEHKKAL